MAQARIASPSQWVRCQRGSVFLTLIVVVAGGCGASTSVDSTNSSDQDWVVAARAGSRPGLILIRADGAQEVRLTSNADGHPAWSREGDRLAFSREATDGASTIVVGEVNGDGAGTELGELRTLTAGGDPSWSPSGDLLAFVRLDGVYVIDADGGEPRRLARLDLAADPSWSADGKTVIVSDPSKGIIEVPVSGHGEIRVLTSSVSDTAPAMSNQGALAFSRRPDPASGVREIWLQKEGHQTRLTFAATDKDPDWSSDSSAIAFVRQPVSEFVAQRLRAAEIYIVFPSTQRVQQLTDNTDPDLDPSWRPR